MQAAIEERGEPDGEGEVYEHRIKRGIAGDRHAERRERVDRAGKALRSRHIGADRQAAGPTDQEGRGVAGPRVQAEQDGGEKLDDPDAAEKLELDGIGLGNGQDEHDRPDLHHQRHDLGHGGFLRFAAIGAEELLVEIPGEKVGAGDGHDCRRHERADGDAGKGHAHEPRRKRREEQRRHGEVRPILSEAGGVGRILSTPAAMAM